MSGRAIDIISVEFCHDRHWMKESRVRLPPVNFFNILSYFQVSITLLTIMSDCLDNRRQIDVIFIDFDRESNRLLLKKLGRFSIPPNISLKFFLKGTYLYVQLKTVKSVYFIAWVYLRILIWDLSYF